MVKKQIQVRQLISTEINPQVNPDAKIEIVNVNPQEVKVIYEF